MARIAAPKPNLFYAAGDTVYVAAYASESSRMSLSVNGALRKSADNAVALLDTLYGLAAGDHLLTVQAQGASGLAADTLNLTVPLAPQNRPLPQGVKEGITYHADDDTNEPGGYRLLTDVKIDRLNLPFVDLPDVGTAIPALQGSNAAVQLKVFPNPVQDALHVEVSAAQKNAALQLLLYNMLGQPVLQQPLNAAPDGSGYAAVLPCNALPQGTYILSVQTDKGKQVAGKIVFLHAH